jgi:hypothetical protein
VEDHICPISAVQIGRAAESSVRAQILDWPTREKIALGTAKGLVYLHEVSLLSVSGEAVNSGTYELFEEGGRHLRGSKNLLMLIRSCGLCFGISRPGFLQSEVSAHWLSADIDSS